MVNNGNDVAAFLGVKNIGKLQGLFLFWEENVKYL